MGQVYSHLSEEERRIIRIEIGNGTSIRRIAGLIGRRASTVSRGIKRNTWFPSNENESYRPYRPERLKTGPWTGRCHIAGPARRKAGRTRIDPSMADEIQAIVDETDNRPMRVLGYRTPAEAFADELLSLTEQQGCCTSK